MKFTETHDWISLSGDQATIGITEYAQKELGEIVYIELPQLGHTVQEGEEVVVLESTKAAIDIYAPLSGEIIEINTTLNETPQKINESPEKEGWLYKIRLTQKGNFDSLMDQAAYTAFTKT